MTFGEARLMANVDDRARWRSAYVLEVRNGRGLPRGHSE